MLTQVQIIPEPNAPQKEKGDFFEDLLRAIMESQRYRVTERISFTGTEIDLLCQHMDRPGDTAVVECKARTSIVSGDLKNFAYDVLIAKRAKYGFFVHTSELQNQAAGTVAELRADPNVVFWGPDKVIDLLQHSRLIVPPPGLPDSPSLTLTKTILLYSYSGRFWLRLFSNTVVATHFQLARADGSDNEIPVDALKWIIEIDELRGLTRLETGAPAPSNLIARQAVSFDAVAEIQEAEEWDDYRPVGSKYFVGRSTVRHELYQLVLSPLSSSTRRVFFIESKSGWGKSSLLAELRARSRNKRNRNSFFVLAVDSRSASTGEFVSLAVAKLVGSAARAGFIPESFSKVNVASSLDTLASSEMRALLKWLRAERRVMVLAFDQFEDMFRKSDLFRTFHKLMMDVNDAQENFIVGFSWKSEINIAIDNPAYSLWQQTRDIAEPIRLDEFLAFEVDRVLRQLEVISGHQLPGDLKRRLKEGSQGFPWLTKRLSIHCYHQMQKGVTPEELVDQNLNVDLLLKEDMEALSADEARALHLVARRGYEGDPFDVAEIDDKIREVEIHSLLDKRLIVRSGGKYNVYWDIFRDFLVEGKAPTLGESFLLRQFPTPCVSTLELLLRDGPLTLEEILRLSLDLQEGTALNRLRELRYLGAATKFDGRYTVRPSIESLDHFHAFVRERLNEHIVVRSLRRLTGDSISHDDVVAALRGNFKGYSFGRKTWEIYASYFIAWLRYAGVDFGRRLGDSWQRARGIVAFLPQWRPDRDCDVFLSLKGHSDATVRDKKVDKALYDLKALGLLGYGGKSVSLTKRGLTLLKLDDSAVRAEIARLALALPKVQQAYEAWKAIQRDPSTRFEQNLGSVLSSIRSESYRKVAAHVLKAWGRFIADEVDGPPLFSGPS